MNATLKTAAGQVPRVINIAAGIWLMAMPAVFGYAGTAASIGDRIAGPFIVCFGTVAIWEPTRNVRFANLPFAAWAVVAPLFVSGHPLPAAAASVATGLLVAALSLIRGPVRRRFAGGWAVLWRKTRPENWLEPR